MKPKTNCPMIRELLAGYQDGWLEASDRKQVEEHLASCASCREELDLDRELLDRVKVLEASEVPVMTWTRPKPALWLQPRFAWAASLLLIILVTTGLLWPRKPTVSEPTEALAIDDRALDKAHMTMTLTDSSSDPNRAILMTYSKAQERRAQQ